MKAKFSGHDTFPMRYGWLFKSLNHLKNNGKLQVSNELSTRDAIVKLGVGKNMVNAIRYWSESASLIKLTKSDSEFVHNITENGDFLAKVDPYLEHIGTIWLVHFWLNFNQTELTAFRYFFNYSNVQHFEKSKLIGDFSEDCKRLISGGDTKETTLKKDIDCFLNTYSKKGKLTKATKSTDITEEYFTSPLAELNLVKAHGNGFYLSDLAERSELPIEIFAYSLAQYIISETIDSKLYKVDFDSILRKPCSPGRIFRLSESGLGQKLDEVEKYTDGSISWDDSLGLRQVKISENLLSQPTMFLDDYYGGK